MGILDKFISTEKLSNITIKDPRKVFQEVLRYTSGSGISRELKYNIFYQIIAFKGVVDGVGTSSLVSNVAIALAEAGLTVLVVDTSILQPVQDVLLNTGAKDYPEDKIFDWFDLPFTNESPLHVSKINKNISVLSFYGKSRGVADILSTNDSNVLVEMAFSEFHNKFDIILVDCCHELTNINTASLQMSQKVIQVWNDTPTVISNIDGFIDNCVALACPLDKMRYVVISRDNPDVIGGLDDLLKQYRFRLLCRTPMSRDINRVFCECKPVWSYVSDEPDIIEYNMAIIEIVKHLLGISDENQPKGTITSDDIVQGKVDGTLSQKFSEENKGLGGITITLEEADAQLDNTSESADDFDADDEYTSEEYAEDYEADDLSSEEYNEQSSDDFDAESYDEDYDAEQQSEDYGDYEDSEEPQQEYGDYEQEDAEDFSEESDDEYASETDDFDEDIDIFAQTPESENSNLSEESDFESSDFESESELTESDIDSNEDDNSEGDFF